jgi:ATP phosphoribosyltransferase regulatory subunit
MQLVCQGPHAPVAIANGGRYNKLLKKFSPVDADATGVGFSFSVGEVRVLLGNASGYAPAPNKKCWLVAFQRSALLNQALNLQQECHRRGEQAELWPHPCNTKEEAEIHAADRGISLLNWLS